MRIYGSIFINQTLVFNLYLDEVASVEWDIDPMAGNARTFISDTWTYVRRIYMCGAPR